jgi:hypothetical protein
MNKGRVVTRPRRKVVPSPEQYNHDSLGDERLLPQNISISFKILQYASQDMYFRSKTLSGSCNGPRDLSEKP